MSSAIKNIKIIITGPPGSGKSTLILKIIAYLKAKGYKIGGITTPEIRKGQRRTGFKIVNISTGENAIMASVFYKSSFKVGRYSVNIDSIEKIGVTALLDALNNADVIVIDEIGKMELLSRRFVDTLKTIFKSDKAIIATIGEKLISYFYNNIVENEYNIKLIRITPRAWENQYAEIITLLGV
ncbi:MAG: NTPase [Candidatus Asgardarchaeia archaeon]